MVRKVLGGLLVGILALLPVDALAVKLVWDANLRAAATYVTRPYPGRITLIHNTLQGDREIVREKWAKVADAGVDYGQIDCAHEDMLRESTVREVAKWLGERLDRARR